MPNFYRNRKYRRSSLRDRMFVERLEPRLALSATGTLDPASYAPGSLLVKLSEAPVSEELFGISSFATTKYTSNPLNSLPTSVREVLSDFGVIGAGRVFLSAATEEHDNTIFGISSLSADSSRTSANTANEADVAAQEVGLDRWFRINLPVDADLEAVIASLEGNSEIAAVEPDFLFRLSGMVPPASAGSQSYTATAVPSISTDPAIASQWHLNAIKAPEAWAYLESQGLPAGGSSEIVVAVIDTGVDYTHEDLAANMWVNRQEIAGNGIDDDGNGFIDDIHGVAVVSDYRSHSGDPMDDHAHGTHVAGIIAASANNTLGGVGVAYNSKIMAIKALQYSGVGSSTDIAEAIYYAVENGADIINMSFGSYSESRIVRDALEVAFGQCVLVAAAGNNNELIDRNPMWPAAYNWVLGVEASDSGGSKAAFSNYDLTQYTRLEYEVRAPGVDVYSSLPNNQYAAWDGTSMAAPAVSGLAALLRTKFSNKDLYSSRFIMGQVAAISTDAGRVAVIDAMHALTNTPQPNLTLLDYWVFDTASQDADNDDDGRVDAGETIDLAIALKNRWGKAEDVTVTLQAWANGAVAPDPYVTIATATVNYGAIGSFNEDDNGLIYDNDGVITGVHAPLSFTTRSDTPNDHVISFRLTITARNGLNPSDPTIYSFATTFFITVQRGRELPRVISEDLTLTKNDFWIINGPTVINEGVTVTVEPGTHIQWGSPAAGGVYDNPPESPYIANMGTLLFNGSPESYVYLFPLTVGARSGLNYDTSTVSIFNSGGGRTILRFTHVVTPHFHTGGGAFNKWWYGPDGSYGFEIYDSIIYEQADDVPIEYWVVERTMFKGTQAKVIAKGSSPQSAEPDSWELRPVSFSESAVSLDAFWNYGARFDNSYVYIPVTGDNPNRFEVAGHSLGEGNALLNPLWRPGPLPLKVFGPPRGGTISAGPNFFGTTRPELLGRTFWDQNDDINYGAVDYSSVLTVPSEGTFPFVADIVLSTDSGSGITQVGAESVTFTVTYNRDMDTSVQPQISFGPDEPLSDYTIHPINGGWQGPRTWVGVFKVSPLTGDGYQLVRTAGARAADKAWLETAVEKGRFRFEIITSGAESMNLQANGAGGRVELSWSQDDFDLLAGYNIYRSGAADGTYQRVNSTLVPAAVTTFVDTTVSPGSTYFYTFRVAQTDGSESADSNVASAAVPLPDNTPPVIVHTPAVTAVPNAQFTIRADVSDNVGVVATTLHYRRIGTSQFAQVGMTHTTNGRFSVTLPASLMESPGFEYFIVASDGANLTSDGSSQNPHQISIAGDSAAVLAGATSGILNGDGIAMGRFGWQDADGATEDRVAVASRSFHGRVSLLSLGLNEWAWTYVAGPTFAGTDSFSLSLIDDVGYSTEQVFVVTGASVAPAITWSMIINQNLTTAIVTYRLPAIGVFGQPIGESPTRIVVTSSNTSLIPTPAASYSGADVPASISFTPAPGQSGRAELTLQVEDAGADGSLSDNADNRLVNHRLEVVVLEIISSAGAVVLSKDGSSKLYADTQPVTVAGQPADEVLFGFTFLRADEGVRGKELVASRSGVQYRVSADSSWQVGSLFGALRNASTRVLGPRTFAVTTVPAGYEISPLLNQVNPAVTVRRGRTYTFALTVADHPFYLQTTGGGYVAANAYEEGFSGNGSTTGRFDWVVPEDAPDELFYQSGLDADVFGKIIVVD